MNEIPKLVASTTLTGPLPWHATAINGDVAAEITRLALFLTTPAARHITGQTLHVSHGAMANFG